MNKFDRVEQEKSEIKLLNLIGEYVCDKGYCVKYFKSPFPKMSIESDEIEFVPIHIIHVLKNNKLYIALLYDEFRNTRFSINEQFHKLHCVDGIERFRANTDGELCLFNRIKELIN